MKGFKPYLHSSIGRKQLMAVTGFLLCGFLISHLVGNLLLFKGFDPKTGACAFNDYAASLMSMGVLLYLAEVILFVVFIVHLGLGIKLTIENRQARGSQKYYVNTKSGDMTIASRTMIFTGLWILVFLVLHLLHFKFADHSGDEKLFGVVKEHFQSLPNVVYYIISFIFLGAHLFHGVQSMFQTFGLNHEKYNAMIRNISTLYALVIVLGYSSIPLWFLLTGGKTTP